MMSTLDVDSSHPRLGPRLGVIKKEKKTQHNHQANVETSILEDISRGKVVSSSYYWENDHDPVTIDGSSSARQYITMDPHSFIRTGKLRRVRHYLGSARALYELQYQPKRANTVLKMKSNSFGFKNRSTFDPLAALISPLRSPQVLDNWSGYEINIYEDAFEQYGKNFHSIAQLLPNKTVKDVIAFYYVWKKHRNGMTWQRGERKNSESDESRLESDVELTGETLQLATKLHHRQTCLDEYLAGCRELQGAISSIQQRTNKRVSLADFGLHRLSAALQPSIPLISPLRTPSTLDEWTPYELRIFELALECYGKEFDQVARMIKTKTCRQVISLYYLWKKEAHYPLLKNGWEAKRDPDQITPVPTTSHPHPSITTQTHSTT